MIYDNFLALYVSLIKYHSDAKGARGAAHNIHTTLQVVLSDDVAPSTSARGRVGPTPLCLVLHAVQVHCVWDRPFLGQLLSCSVCMKWMFGLIIGIKWSGNSALDCPLPFAYKLTERRERKGLGKWPTGSLWHNQEISFRLYCRHMHQYVHQSYLLAFLNQLLVE